MDGSKTILCIEDDHFISELYIRALRKAGYEVDSTVSGAEGLQKALTKSYDFILLDIMTPDLTGVEVLEKVRGNNEDRIPKTRVVVTTNLDQNDDNRKRVEELADGYLIKAEITPSRLVELLQEMGSQQRPSSTPQNT